MSYVRWCRRLNCGHTDTAHDAGRCDRRGCVCPRFAYRRVESWRDLKRMFKLT